MPLVHGQIIAPEVVAFRKEWFSSEEKTRELKRRKSRVGVLYEDIPSKYLTEVSSNLAEVDISSFRPEWEDADTLLLHSPWWKFQKPVAVRLTGIDAPEIAHPGDPTEWFRFHQEQPWGRKALQKVEEFTTGKDLRVFIGTGKDQRTYNRYLGVVAADEDLVNIEALHRGWAAALPWGESGTDILDRNELMRIEREAAGRKEGLWGDSFFQKYSDVSRGLGGRLTFNTLTDLSRLSRNYHLAAVESYLSSTGTPRDPSLGNYLGKRLIPSYGRFFSGHNSNYNTISGMRHGGWAGAMRPSNTDFGSGLTTEMFGSVKAFIQASKQSVRKAVKERLNPLKVARSEIEILEAGPAIGRLGFVEGKYTEQISWSQEGVEAMFRGQGIDPSLTTLPSLFHEGSEVVYGRKIIQKAGAKTAEEANFAFKFHLKFGSHISPGVIVDEVLMAMKEGPEAFQAMKRFRVIEKEHIRARYTPIEKPGFLRRLFGRKKTPQQQADVFRHQQQSEAYISRVEKIYSTMEKNYLPRFAPRFSADHGAWNTITGMQHSGMSAGMRKVNTDFGSRSDPLRAIARGLGLSFENLLRSPAWKEALGKAKHIKRLSSGSFGEAHMFRTTIHGQEVSMVRKTIHGEAEKNLQMLAARDAAKTGRTIEESAEIYRKSMDLSREGGFYRALGETPSVPSTYGMTRQKQELWMEHMPGEEIGNITRRNPHFKMSPEGREQIEETMSTAIEMGIFNPDIHRRNILYSATHKRATILDFGQAEARKELTTRDVTRMHRDITGTAGIYKTKHEMLQKGARKGLEHGAARNIGSEVQSVAAGPRARKKKQLLLAENLRRAKESAWEAAYYGGNNHIINSASRQKRIK